MVFDRILGLDAYGLEDDPVKQLIIYH